MKGLGVLAALATASSAATQNFCKDWCNQQAELCSVSETIKYAQVPTACFGSRSSCMQICLQENFDPEAWFEEQLSVLDVPAELGVHVRRGSVTSSSTTSSLVATPTPMNPDVFSIPRFTETMTGPAELPTSKTKAAWSGSAAWNTTMKHSSKIGSGMLSTATPTPLIVADKCIADLNKCQDLHRGHANADETCREELHDCYKAHPELTKPVWVDELPASTASKPTKTHTNSRVTASATAIVPDICQGQFEECRKDVRNVTIAALENCKNRFDKCRDGHGDKSWPPQTGSFANTATIKALTTYSTHRVTTSPTSVTTSTVVSSRLPDKPHHGNGGPSKIEPLWSKLNETFAATPTPHTPVVGNGGPSKIKGLLDQVDSTAVTTGTPQKPTPQKPKPTDVTPSAADDADQDKCVDKCEATHSSCLQGSPGIFHLLCDGLNKVCSKVWCYGSSSADAMSAPASTKTSTSTAKPLPEATARPEVGSLDQDCIGRCKEDFTECMIEAGDTDGKAGETCRRHRQICESHCIVHPGNSIANGIASIPTKPIKEERPPKASQPPRDEPMQGMPVKDHVLTAKTCEERCDKEWRMCMETVRPVNQSHEESCQDVRPGCMKDCEAECEDDNDVPAHDTGSPGSKKDGKPRQHARDIKRRRDYATWPNLRCLSRPNGSIQ